LIFMLWCVISGICVSVCLWVSVSAL